MQSAYPVQTPSNSAATDSAEDELLHKIKQANQQDHLLPIRPNGEALTVVVGVSGGADSVCLVHALAQLASQWRLALHVAHLDHNLRPQSGAEALFVAELAVTLGLPLHSTRLAPGTLQRQPGGLEAAARRARYTFLAGVASNVTPATQVPLLLLAHHADDQAETVLLNLVRGSGLQGLGAMRPISDLDLGAWTADRARLHPMVRVVRPLLGVRRHALVAYLRRWQVAWCEDASNQDTALARNRVRHLVLPQLEAINPAVVETLARTAHVLAAEAERVNRLDCATLATLLLEPEACATDDQHPLLDRLVLDLDRLCLLAIADQRGVLRQALARLQTDWHDISFAAVESLLIQLHAHPHSSGPHPLPHQLTWSVAGATLTAPARLSLHRAAALPFQPDHPYLDAEWRQGVGAFSLPAAGEVSLPDDWILRIQSLPVEQLPPDWRRPDQPWQVYLDADTVQKPVLTTPQPGMRFAPLGMNGQHKRLGDFFTDCKIPTGLRSGWPLLIDQQNGVVLWVCGLRLADPVRICAGTRRVLHLWWHRQGGN
ncbi:MAG: tRNA lysidine(34) synthetase TilS [Chloroflexota bacterium]|nr:tRNA lysidine(34) synthetase TilS [Chloroflexota bacterium]